MCLFPYLNEMFMPTYQTCKLGMTVRWTRLDRFTRHLLTIHDMFKSFTQCAYLIQSYILFQVFFPGKHFWNWDSVCLQSATTRTSKLRMGTQFLLEQLNYTGSLAWWPWNFNRSQGWTFKDKSENNSNSIGTLLESSISTFGLWNPISRKLKE